MEIADVNGSILCVNDAWCRLFRRARREVIGVTWDSLEPNGTGLKRSWMQCLSVGSSVGAYVISHRDGTYLSLDYGRSLFRDMQNTAVAVVTVYRPGPTAIAGGATVSQMRSLEHGLRNVLTSISGTVQLMDSMADDSGSVRGAMDHISGAVSAGVDLLDGLSLYLPGYR